MILINKRVFLINFTALVSSLYFLRPLTAHSAWEKDHFNSKTTEDLISLITNNSEISQSDKINIKAPEIAENGAVVPVSVSTDIANVKNISIIVDNNPSPLTSTFELNPQLEAYVSTRVKMAKSSNIIAIVNTVDNQFFTSSKSIKVTIGGCGG